MNLINTFKVGACAAMLIFVTACSGGDSADVVVQNTDDGSGGKTPPVAGSFDASPLIDNIADNVILATYQGMANATDNLLGKVTILTDGNLTTENLQSAQNAWFEVRKYWESSEGFLWGPIDTEGFDPKLDDWPVNKIDLDNILADTDVDLGNQGAIDQLETTVKGFHTIEYMLFNDGTGNEDTNGCGTANAGTQDCFDNILTALSNGRRASYLLGITANVDGVAQETLSAWLTNDGDFITDVKTAGQGSNVYTSQRALVEEFVQGMIAITDEVGAGKLGDPFAEGNPLTVESKFSGNSLTDFQYNIRSLRNLYCGAQSIGTESTSNACNQGNQGLNMLVVEHDEGLHQRIVSAIDDTVFSIADIPGPYYQAVEASVSDANTASAIQNAIDNVLALNDLLLRELLPLLDEVNFSF